MLGEFGDLLRLAMAGNLKDYEIVDARGQTVRGRELMYGASPAGYAAHPWETVNYAACHDNETLFDQVAFSCCTHSLMYGLFVKPPQKYRIREGCSLFSRFRLMRMGVLASSFDMHILLGTLMRCRRFPVPRLQLKSLWGTETSLLTSPVGARPGRS